MVTLLAVKTFCKKTWTWLKYNWKVPFIIAYTLILWLIFRQSNKAKDILKTRVESYKSQIDAINKAHEEEVEKRNRIFNEYNKILEGLARKFEEEQKELDNKKKKEVKDLVEKYHNDPDGLAKEIADKFGFNYLEE